MNIIIIRLNNGVYKITPRPLVMTSIIPSPFAGGIATPLTVLPEGIKQDNLKQFTPYLLTEEEGKKAEALELLNDHELIKRALPDGKNTTTHVTALRCMLIDFLNEQKQGLPKKGFVALSNPLLGGGIDNTIRIAPSSP